MPKGRFLHTSGHQFGSQRMAGKSPVSPMLQVGRMAAMGGKSTLDIQQTAFGGIWYLHLR